MATQLREPVAAIGDPPAHEDDGDAGDQAPHQGQVDVGQQTEDDHQHYQNLALKSAASTVLAIAS